MERKEGLTLMELTGGKPLVIFPGDDDHVKSEIINSIIDKNDFDRNLISDGYHTFGELYEHRIALWITVCRLIAHTPAYRDVFPVWRSQQHSDGTAIAGWFILGLNQDDGRQITYHLPEKEWKNCWFADTLPQAPAFDGHCAKDVLKRLKDVV